MCILATVLLLMFRNLQNEQRIKCQSQENELNNYLTHWKNVE